MRWPRALFAAFLAALAGALPASAGIPVVGVRASLNGEGLILSFDIPVPRTSACQTFVRWEIRDRVNLSAVGNQGVVPLWATTFRSPTHTYNRCRAPRRLSGQPFAEVTRPRPGWVHVNNARNRLRVPWTPSARVCIHAVRAGRVLANVGVACVASRIVVGDNARHVHTAP
ncbi:MAG: hypothetical protein ISP32_08200 [Thermoleophilia bacterium]|nr:hypothetical protein [Thermoleophilia bacterium]